MVRFMSRFGFAAFLVAALALPCAAFAEDAAPAKEAKKECKECCTKKKDGEKCDSKKAECVKNGYIVTIEGMHCAACEAAVKKALSGVEGVKHVMACHKAGKACVAMADKAELTKEAAEKALAGTDFKVTDVKKCEKCDGKKDGKCEKKAEKKD